MMSYMPAVRSMNPVGRFPFGPGRTAILFDQVESDGRVQYAFLAVLYDDAAHEPVLIVASEVNVTAAQFGGGSHFLGVFPGEGHVNMGASDDWADADKFFAKALRLAADRLGLPAVGPHAN